MAVIQAWQEQNRNTYICYPVCQWVWLWSRQGRNRTEIRTSVTQYVSEYGCDQGRTGTEILPLSAGMSVSMTVIQAEQEQKCVPLSPGVSMSMTEPDRAGTEIRTSFIWYVCEYDRNTYLCHPVFQYDCEPSRAGTEMRTCVTRYVNEYDSDPGRAGTEIRTSVTRYANEQDKNTYLCHPLCQWVWINQAEHKQKYLPLWPGMSMSMTEPGSAQTEILLSESQLGQKSDILRSVSISVNQQSKNKYILLSASMSVSQIGQEKKIFLSVSMSASMAEQEQKYSRQCRMSASKAG